jgi:hypothetical protein
MNDLELLLSDSYNTTLINDETRIEDRPTLLSLIEDYPDFSILGGNSRYLELEVLACDISDDEPWYLTPYGMIWHWDAEDNVIARWQFHYQGTGRFSKNELSELNKEVVVITGCTGEDFDQSYRTNCLLDQSIMRTKCITEFPIINEYLPYSFDGVFQKNMKKIPWVQPEPNDD